MSEEQDRKRAEDAPSAPKKPRSVPSAARVPNGRGGWIVFAVIAASFLAMRLMNPETKRAKEISQTEFRTAVEANQVERVERVRKLESGSTYLVGRIHGDDIDFRVNLVPNENERLMEFLSENAIKCPIREEEPIFGPFMQQLLIFGVFAALMWFLIYRKMLGGGSGGMFSFGKSKARLMDENKGKGKITFKDVAGVDEAKEEVQEIVEFLKDPGKFTKLGARIPRGILLVGPPGTGKTLLAKAIAGEAKVPFFSISGSDFEEMFVGVGASRVRDMFEQGKKNAPCIIFIDEIDSVGQKRNAGGFTAVRSADQTLNAMLVEMDGFGTNDGVIVIAATNRPDILDPALLRPGRFDRQVHVDLPTLKGREEILKLHASKVKLAPDADLSRLARGTSGHSGADLANIINEAALLAARNGMTEIPHSVLEEARDKVFWGRERKSAGFTRKEYETTAWHEAGDHTARTCPRRDDDAPGEGRPQPFAHLLPRRASRALRRPHRRGNAHARHLHGRSVRHCRRHRHRPRDGVPLWHEQVLRLPGFHRAQPVRRRGGPPSLLVQDGRGHRRGGAGAHLPSVRSRKEATGGQLRQAGTPRHHAPRERDHGRSRRGEAARP